MPLPQAAPCRHIVEHASALCAKWRNHYRRKARVYPQSGGCPATFSSQILLPSFPTLHALPCTITQQSFVFLRRRRGWGRIRTLVYISESRSARATAISTVVPNSILFHCYAAAKTRRGNNLQHIPTLSGRWWKVNVNRAEHTKGQKRKFRWKSAVSVGDNQIVTGFVQLLSGLDEISFEGWAWALVCDSFDDNIFVN